MAKRANEIETVSETYPDTGTVRILTVTDTDQYAMLERWYFDTFPAVAEDSASIHAQIVANILSTNPDDVLDLRETLDSASDMIGKPIMLHGIESVMPSSYGGIFAVVTYQPFDISTQRPFGDVDRMSIGSPQMLAQLAVLHQNGRLPAVVKVAPIKKGGSAGKNAPLYFRRVDY